MDLRFDEKQNVLRGGRMSEWNFTDFASKDNLLRTVREQSDQMMALASEPGVWENPTASGHWQVRDVIAHLVDTTEGYFAGWDAARGEGTVPDALGVKGMDKHVNDGALALRSVPQDELLARLDKDRAQMMSLMQELDAGTLGAGSSCPTSTWAHCRRSSIRSRNSSTTRCTRGTSAKALAARTRWTVTRPISWCRSASSCGSRRRSADPSTRSRSVCASRETTEARPGRRSRPRGSRSSPVTSVICRSVLDFDPASFVLTAMGRTNGGTAHGDGSLTERFCNLFFRI